jgi:hypothetical protein
VNHLTTTLKLFSPPCGIARPRCDANRIGVLGVGQVLVC